MNLDDLFAFPTVMVDGQNEEDKRDKSDIMGTKAPKVELDIVYGEAEYPYYDFTGIEDRWLPDEESFERALDRKFNACLVKFINVGHLLVPWTKDKFKKQMRNFIRSREDDKETTKKVTVLKVTPEQMQKMLEAAQVEKDISDGTDS